MNLLNVNAIYGRRDITWMDDSACLSVSDPDIFFPPRDKVKYKETADKAKEFCLGTADRPECPVRNKCLWYAVDSEESHGIWGGLSHRERNAIVRKWQREYKSTTTLKDYILQLKTKGK